MINVSMGGGLVNFAPPEPEQPAEDDPMATPPVPRIPAQLNLCIYQGSDGWCPAVYLMNHLRLNMCLFVDSSHRACNDVKAALGEANLWDCVMIWNVPFCVHYGPWMSSDFWRQSKEAAQAYVQANNDRCPLFQMLLNLESHL